MVKLEIVSPIKGKGYDEEKSYLCREVVKDELNYIELGLVLRDEADPVKTHMDLEVEVKTPDKDQDVVMKSTGNVMNVIESGAKKQIYYYPFHYEFKKPGAHNIQFLVTTEQGVKTTNIQVVGVGKDER